MISPSEFLSQIEAFLAKSGMTPTRFGIEAVRDPNFVHDLRKGRVPSLKVAGDILSFMSRWSAAGTAAETTSSSKQDAA